MWEMIVKDQPFKGMTPIQGEKALGWRQTLSESDSLCSLLRGACQDDSLCFVESGKVIVDIIV